MNLKKKCANGSGGRKIEIPDVFVDIVIDSSGVVVLLANGMTVLQGKTELLPELLSPGKRTAIVIALKKI